MKIDHYTVEEEEEEPNIAHENLADRE